MKSYIVYMLRCSDNSFYVGVTNNVKRRLEEHSIGKKGSYTFSRRPVVLVYEQKFEDVQQAISFEKKIKKWSRLKKEALVIGEYDKLKELASCKNNSNYKNRYPK